MVGSMFDYSQGGLVVGLMDIGCVGANPHLTKSTYLDIDGLHAT